MKSQAEMHAATCFLNSLFREWDGFTVESRGPVGLGKHIAIALSADEMIRIPFEKESVLGRRLYLGRFYFEKNHDLSEISFEDLVNRLCRHLTHVSAAEPMAVENFKKRVRESLANIESSLALRADAIRELFESSLDFKSSEQALMIGHNFHPTPKSRDEFSESDLRTYAPEFGGRFHLEWFMADPTILHQKRAATFSEESWTERLARKDLADSSDIDTLSKKGFVPLPMHPWQRRVLEQNATIRDYLKSGRLVPVGVSRDLWYPTSSLRSIYREEAPYMLKFSMSVKLTNSIRHLLVHEVERGIQLQDVLATEKGQEFLSRYPNFKVITEPAYLTLKDAEGNPMPETVIVCRWNPFQGAAVHGKAVLATLAQDAPLGGENLIQKLIRTHEPSVPASEASRKWFAAFLSVVVEPLMRAQCDYGIALGAHQQNLVLDIQNGYPIAAFFRDCQGTGYSELGYSYFADQVASISRENGNVLNEKMANYLFSYYLILNSTFNVITALAAEESVSEEELIVDLRNFLMKMRSAGVQDPACLDYLLESEILMHKGNFLCSLRGLNENTTNDPLSIYTPVKNALRSVC